MTLAVILPEPLMLTSNIAPLPPPLTVVAEMFEKLGLKPKKKSK